MLISFALKNWMSFRDTATLTMVASKERQHGERIPRIKKYPLRVLPIAAIYGGNASGKTNLFKAINLAKNLVVKGTQPETRIPREYFRLDAECASLPTEFQFEILVNDTAYQFSFSVTSDAVIEEKLVEILSTREKTLYHRYKSQPNFDSTLAKDQFLQFAFKGTRNNQLFLTNTVNQQIERFKPIYDWFKNSLELVAPDSRFEPFEQFLEENHPLFTVMNQFLANLDTGIIQLGNEEINLEHIDITDGLKRQIQEEIGEGESVRLLGNKERFIISRQNGELTAKKLVAYHHNNQQEKIPFDIKQESDGTQRVIDLIPGLLELINPQSKKVFLVDEIDRSLHTLLTRNLLETYLNQCSPETRSQLLFTTHDLLLMDQKLLRRDEMWVTERDNSGNSSLISFSEYDDIRYDKDIRKSYLQGRMGGIPHILPTETLSVPTQITERGDDKN